MTTNECPTCGRRIHEDDVRTGTNFGSWSEPGYDFEGCIHCCPTSDDREAAYDAHVDRMIDEYREGW